MQTQNIAATFPIVNFINKILVNYKLEYYVNNNIFVCRVAFVSAVFDWKTEIVDDINFFVFINYKYIFT